ncbi:MAG: hypothetical protein WD847_03115 [Pirellulales bacterium]
MDDAPNPYQAPATEFEPSVEPPPLAAFHDRKRRLLWWMVVLFAAAGFLAGMVESDSLQLRGLNIVHAVAWAVLLLKWCAYDREEFDVERWRLFAFMMVICPGPLIMIPAHLFATRGWEGVVATLKAAAFLVLLLSMSFASAFAGWWLLGPLE